MKKYQKTALIEVIGTANDGDYLVQNEGNDTDQWIIPKETFEATYQEMKHDFGWAITQLKKGYKVARNVWNGKGMWLWYVPAWEGDIDASPDPFQYLEASQFIAVKTADDKLVPWLASQTDILAEDWEVVE